jgi:hypothetical protein
MGQWLVADLSVMDVHFQLWACWSGFFSFGPRATFATERILRAFLAQRQHDPEVARELGYPIKDSEESESSVAA